MARGCQFMQVAQTIPIVPSTGIINPSCIGSIAVGN